MNRNISIKTKKNNRLNKQINLKKTMMFQLIVKKHKIKLILMKL